MLSRSTVPLRQPTAHVSSVVEQIEEPALAAAGRRGAGRLLRLLLMLLRLCTGLDQLVLHLLLDQLVHVDLPLFELLQQLDLLLDRLQQLTVGLHQLHPVLGQLHLRLCTSLDSSVTVLAGLHDRLVLGQARMGRIFPGLVALLDRTLQFHFPHRQLGRAQREA